MSVVGDEVNVMKANIAETNAMDTPFTRIGLVGQWRRFVVTSGGNDIDIQLDYRYPQLKSCSAKGGTGVVVAIFVFQHKCPYIICTVSYYR